MNLHIYSIAAHILLYASVLVVSFGAHLREQSPWFPEYENQCMSDIFSANPGTDLGQNLFFLGFAWPFVGCCTAFVGLAFTVGFSASFGLQRCNRVIGVFVAVMFSLGCGLGVILGQAEATESFRWGFCVLGGVF